MKKVNIGEVVWFLILLGFSTYMFILIKSGNIVNYIHPQMIRYTKFACTIFMILSVIQFTKVFSESDNFKGIMMMFFIPLVLGGIVYGKEELGIANKEIYNINIKMSDHNHDEYNDECSSKFLDVYNDVNSNMHIHENDVVELVGYVHKDISLNENQFLISRIIMACCVADSQVISIICEDENKSGLKEQEWIKIIGRVEDCKNGKRIIRAISLEKIDKPEQMYIYQ